MIDVRRVLSRIREPFKPQDLVRANDAIVRVARPRGDFPLESRDAVELFEGQLFVVPRGTRHRPVAERDAVTLLLEPP